MELKVTVHSTSNQAFDRLQAVAPYAIVRAFNRAIASAKTVMVREVATDTGLKSGTVRDKIWVSEARPDRFIAQLQASQTRIPLIEYGARGPEPSRGRGSGVRARLKGATGRYPHAFIATMKSGHRGVFQRRPAAGQLVTLWPRLPVHELHGPSIVRVFTKHVDVGQQRGHEQLAKNLQSEFRFAMRRSA